MAAGLLHARGSAKYQCGMTIDPKLSDLKAPHNSRIRHATSTSEANSTALTLPGNAFAVVLRSSSF